MILIYCSQITMFDTFHQSSIVNNIKLTTQSTSLLSYSVLLLIFLIMYICLISMIYLDFIFNHFIFWPCLVLLISLLIFKNFGKNGNFHNSEINFFNPKAILIGFKKRWGIGVLWKFFLIILILILIFLFLQFILICYWKIAGVNTNEYIKLFVNPFSYCTQIIKNNLYQAMQICIFREQFWPLLEKNFQNLLLKNQKQLDIGSWQFLNEYSFQMKNNNNIIIDINLIEVLKGAQEEEPKKSQFILGITRFSQKYYTLKQSKILKFLINKINKMKFGEVNLGIFGKPTITFNIIVKDLTNGIYNIFTEEDFTVFINKLENTMKVKNPKDSIEERIQTESHILIQNKISFNIEIFIRSFSLFMFYVISPRWYNNNLNIVYSYDTDEYVYS